MMWEIYIYSSTKRIHMDLDHGELYIKPSAFLLES